MPPTTDRDAYVRPVLRWYAEHHRELPWRAPDRTPWGVLVSEVMLAQTPVTRVLPVWPSWMTRWPTPASLAADSPGEVVRAWGRLGYPRRALRLHEAATVCVARHEGRVPATYEALRALPGVGDYTAGAVLAFAYGERALALDTNVRRVLARAVGGEGAVGAAATRAERERALALLPSDDATAALWSVAVMELGALVCTARSPACGRCPISRDCAWRRAGYPPAQVARRTQRYEGTDRYVRGLLLGRLREATGPVRRRELDLLWPDERQRARALDGLVADGLVEPLPRARYRLPV